MVRAKKDEQYDAQRARAARRGTEISAKGRDIAPLPPVVNPDRRAECRDSLKRFCEVYNPRAFYLTWGKTHLRVIERIEESVSHRALFAVAMDRGAGKTTICRHAVLWAVSYALVRYVFLIGATQPKAEDSLASIKSWMRFLPAYVEDFPEIAYPIGRLGNIAHRAHGQTYDGQETLIEWSKARVVLPYVPVPERLTADGTAGDIEGEWAPTAGHVIGVSGLTGEGIRGSVFTRVSGELMRPDLVLLDDPQTDESAKSLTQNQERENLITGAVLGMAGPDERIAAVMPCTVIHQDDMAARILDRETHPLWRGERTGILQSMPTDMDAWDGYFEIYRRCRSMEPPNVAEANKYYTKHRKALDAGAVATWDHRKKTDEVSAIQSAMNLYCERGSEVFWAEFMNDPIDPNAEAGALTSNEVTHKVDGLRGGVVPSGVEWLTAFVDVHETLLYWAVCAWQPNFSGTVLEYGTHPKQVSSYFAMRDARKTLRHEAPKSATSKQAVIGAGIVKLVDALLGRTWRREDGVELNVGRLLTDAGWLPACVKAALRRVASPKRAAPSRGKGITAAGLPMSEWRYEVGDRRGHYWGHFVDKKGKGRTVVFDANHWKSRFRDGIRTAEGDEGCILLRGRDPSKHRMLGDHCSVEVPTTKEEYERRVEEWHLSPGKSDNHLFDCMVGCMVAASMLGAVLPGSRPKLERKPRVRLSDLRRQRRQAARR